MTFTVTNTGPTEMDLILSIVQEELVRSAKLRPTVRDFSAQAEQGVKQIEIPRYDTHFADPGAQADDGLVADQTIDFAVDTLAISDWKTLPWSLPDRVVRQSRIPVEAELARSAGRKMGNYLDDKIIEQLRLAANGTGGLPDHIRQMSGTGNTEMTLADITLGRQLLKRAEVDIDSQPVYLLVSPEQEKVMLDLDNFRNADSYGSREALVDGEIGKVYGCRVIVHNGLAAAEAIMYVKDAVAIAVQKDLKFETRRAALGRQKTEYAFSMGAGYTVLEQGVKQVLFNSAI